MYSVKVGTTNTDSTGTSENLTEEHEILATGETVGNGEDSQATYMANTIYVSADYWNAPNSKEIKIDASNVNLNIKDFVDTDINLATSTSDSNIHIENAKRGQIETGSGNDNIFVSVQSNVSRWVNKFTVDSGNGNDTITFVNVLNTRFTELDIDTGNGNDVIDISALEANEDASITL